MRTLTIPLGLYVPGTTSIHTAAPALKFIILIITVIVATALSHSIILSGALFLCSLFVLALAKIPPKIAGRQIGATLPLLLFLSFFQLWSVQGSWGERILSISATLLSLLTTITSALIITLTTKISEMLDSLEQWLRPLNSVGISSEKISLAIALTLRLIPLQLGTVYEVLDAQRARGTGIALYAFMIPIMIRSLRRARNIADALWARGAGDSDTQNAPQR